MPRYYKGYRVGSLEKSILKLLLDVDDVEISSDKNKSENTSLASIFKTARQKYEMPLIFKRLKDKGLLRYISKNEELSVYLTSKGKSYVRENFLNIKHLDNHNMKKWNGKWHLVIFDIPESRRKIRNMLRFQLKRIGFIQIQASVWVYPFQCDEIITLIKTYFDLSKEVIYIVADSIEGDVVLKKKFKV